MDRLSGLDASFLYLESSAQLLHVCGIILLDPETIPGGYSFAGFKEALEDRVSEVPLFRRKLMPVPGGIDHPVWVRDEEFDIDRHVHRIAVPAPGDRAVLSELAGHLAGIPLDRSRPLWEMWVIEGLASGQVAVFSKMHHASVDGVSGANMISFLCSLEPTAPPLEVGDQAELRRQLRVPSRAELLGRGLVANLGKPLHGIKMLPKTAGILATSALRAKRGTAMAAPLTAPRTSFNGTITGHRSVSCVDLDLDAVKAIKNAIPGATVNDVVLALTGGALRRYLDARDELPTAPLVACVPVSVHGAQASSSSSNKISSLFTRLGTEIADPRQRILTLAAGNANAKEHHDAIPAETLQDWAEFAAPRTFGLAVRMVSALRLAEKAPVIHNLIVSNVPGPPIPLYFMGARIDALYPLGPIFHGAGLNVTVMSNNGQLHVGLIGCREMLPRIAELASYFPAELDQMGAEVSAAS